MTLGTHDLIAKARAALLSIQPHMWLINGQHRPISAAAHRFS